MKRLLLLLTLLALAMALASCDMIPGLACEHRDANDDGICDYCEATYYDKVDNPVCQHRDADDNEYCDKCYYHYADGADGAVCQHRDTNDNNICDKCSSPYRDGIDQTICRHRDADDNERCDLCSIEYKDGKDVEHSHSFTSWIKYGYDANTPCDEQLFYRTCSFCGAIEWKNGGYEAHTITAVVVDPTCQAGGYTDVNCSVCGFTDRINQTAPTNHSYKSDYSYNNSFHWFGCESCEATTSYAEHTIDSDGFCSVCSQPLAPTEGIIYDLSGDGTYAEVIGYSGTAKKIFIADTYKGVPVTKIYNEAFQIDDNITTVVIPDSVTEIGSYAFYDCLSLTSVTIGNGVTEIGERAFYYCHNLTSVIIPDSVTTIGERAFYDCNSLTSITIPDSVISIGNYAFYGCDSLTSVTIGNGVTSIGSYAFSGCNSVLYTEYEFGKYVKSGDNPYAVLIEITNKNLSAYTIHEDTKHIAYGVFQDCERLTSIVIPDGVISVGISAFHSCDSLTSVTIPETVTYINRYAFYDCDSLTTINYRGTEEEWAEVTKEYNWKPSSTPIIFNYTEE